MNRELKRSVGVVTFATLGGVVVPSVAAAEEAKSPNIIVILADDLGWGDVGYNGNKEIRTPAIDAMVKAGVEFTNFSTVSPLSSSSRASIMTGRHPYRMGIYAAHTGGMKNGEVTIAEVCKSNGYSTGFFGKWHLGWVEPDSQDARGFYSPPQQHGFEETFATRSAVPTWDPTMTPMGWNNWGNKEGQPWSGSKYLTNGVLETENLSGDDSRVIMDRVIPFIDKSVDEGKPFMTCVWFHAPHEPVVAGPEYLEMYKDIESEKKRHYYGCITAMDDQIARLVAHLKEIGEWENTIITFTSDNGPADGLAKQGIASAGPFRGHKHQVFQGGVRVPSLMVWPSTLKAGSKVNTVSLTCDYFPTLISMANLTFEPYKAYVNDGIDLTPTFTNANMERESAYFIGWRRLASGVDGRAVVDGDYKYLYQERATEPELYNIKKDPYEKMNIIEKYPEVAARMELMMQEMDSSYNRSNQGADYKDY
ncbi:MAG: sulfatase-like hydrolase/transferase [Rikenellaceae bacterium]